jgi:predicted CoA-binding protein
MSYNVAVLGASSNPDRYSYKAVEALAEAGYSVFPVHPSQEPVSGVKCHSSLGAVPEPIDTITVYMSERNSTPLIDQIIGVAPRRVILNPGAENDQLKERCESAGIVVQEACTLVLVMTGQFQGLGTLHK